MGATRKIVQIDEERCNGCGQCIPACHEGALQIVDGKARLVAEVYCDGLGNCLGECPEDAITVVERPAREFDFEAVQEHLAATGRERLKENPLLAEAAAEPRGCPGAAARALAPAAAPDQASAGEAEPSQLGNWPVQLRLVPIHAPYLQGARLVISADCVPFALADFHRRFLPGRVLLVGCPKLDDVDLYVRKLAEIFKQNDLESIEVLHMEVPCCFGLVHLVEQALQDAGVDVPLTVTTIGVRGEVIGTRAA